MDFLPHFEEFRKRLLIALSVWGIFSVLSYFFSHALIDFFTWPLQASSPQPLIFQKPYEAFVIHLKAAAFAGLVTASPVILYQFWMFLAPGLYQTEKKIFMKIFLISAALFLVGVVFAFFFVMPWGLRFMLDFQTEALKPMISASAYFSFLLGMLLAFGILFDFPVILVGLAELGIVKTEWLAKSRRGMVVLIFITAAILTPSPDPLSQILLALPLWGLYEISLAIARRREKRKGEGRVDSSSV